MSLGGSARGEEPIGKVQQRGTAAAAASDQENPMQIKTWVREPGRDATLQVATAATGVERKRRECQKKSRAEVVDMCIPG